MSILSKPTATFAAIAMTAATLVVLAPSSADATSSSFLKPFDEVGNCDAEVTKGTEHRYAQTLSGNPGDIVETVGLFVSSPPTVDPGVLNIWVTDGSGAVNAGVNGIQPTGIATGWLDAPVGPPYTIPESGTFTVHADIFGDHTVCYGTPVPPHGNGFISTDGETWNAIDGGGAAVAMRAGFVTGPVVANDDAFTVDENSGVNVLDVLANDTGNDIRVSGLGVTGTVGEVTFTPENVSYTPAPDFVGEDTFTYRIVDSSLSTDVATVTVTVGDTTPPTVVDDSVTFTEGTGSQTFSLTGNDSDDGSGLDLESLVLDEGDLPSPSYDPSTGELTVATDGVEPGVYSSSYTIADNVGNRSDSATVTVTIEAVPAPEPPPFEPPSLPSGVVDAELTDLSDNYFGLVFPNDDVDLCALGDDLRMEAQLFGENVPVICREGTAVIDSSSTFVERAQEFGVSKVQVTVTGTFSGGESDVMTASVDEEGVSVLGSHLETFEIELLVDTSAVLDSDVTDVELTAPVGQTSIMYNVRSQGDGATVNVVSSDEDVNVDVNDLQLVISAEQSGVYRFVYDECYDDGTCYRRTVQVTFGDAPPPAAETPASEPSPSEPSEAADTERLADTGAPVAMLILFGLLSLGSGILLSRRRD